MLSIIKASSVKKCRYACQSLDNVDMYKHAKFHQNIPYGSIVISIFANCKRTYDKIAQPFKMMLGQASSPFFYTVDWTMLKYINIQDLNKIIKAGQELLHVAFALNDPKFFTDAQ